MEKERKDEDGEEEVNLYNGEEGGLVRDELEGDCEWINLSELRSLH